MLWSFIAVCLSDGYLWMHRIVGQPGNAGCLNVNPSSPAVTGLASANVRRHYYLVLAGLCASLLGDALTLLHVNV